MREYDVNPDAAAQVKAIVEHYGGMIYAKSSPGRGMGIYLHLPAERV